MKYIGDKIYGVRHIKWNIYRVEYTQSKIHLRSGINIGWDKINNKNNYIIT